MTFDSDEQALAYVKANQTVPKYVEASREQSKELKALIAGKDFKELLIKKIEHIESQQRAEARKKYSRSVTDFFERLLRPIDNVYHSTGGSKTFSIDNEDINAQFVNTIANIQPGLSLQGWLEEFWMPEYHKDPGGVTFLEYDTKDGFRPFPTYKSINVIRNYESHGQKLEVILFEPKTVMSGDKEVQLWRLVDDVMDRTYIQDGELFVLSEELSFAHPFGSVPGLINSNLIDIDEKPFLRQSPIWPIVDLVKEYSRDQSVKTIYKFLQGTPIHWRMVTECKTCQGTGKVGEHTCKTCDGKGIYMSKDVTDLALIPLPKQGEPNVAPNIAGYVSPDNVTWQRYNDELEMLENIAITTHWGTTTEKAANETATGRFIDVQPVMNRLNKYADIAEFMERCLSEFIANGFDVQKPKDESVVAISYGRRYIIEPPDVILKKYEDAKREGDNVTILDRLFNEYLTSKYKNDPQWLRVALIKANVEPYLHYTIQEVNSIFGPVEAQKKMLFEDWWKTLDFITILNTSEEQLKVQYEEWVSGVVTDDNAESLAQSQLKGSVGGVTSIVELLRAISEGAATPESVQEVLVLLYGFDEQEARNIVGRATINNQQLED